MKFSNVVNFHWDVAIAGVTVPTDQREREREVLCPRSMSCVARLPLNTFTTFTLCTATFVRWEHLCIVVCSVDVDARFTDSEEGIDRKQISYESK